MPDGGVSSLSTTSRGRRNVGSSWAAELHADIDTWRCMWSKCRVLLHPHETGRYFWCTPEHRSLCMAAERKRRGKAA